MEAQMAGTSRSHAKMSLKEPAQTGERQLAGVHGQRQLFFLQEAYIYISISK